MASLIPGFWVARGCLFPLGAVCQRYLLINRTLPHASKTSYLHVRYFSLQTNMLESRHNNKD